MCVNRALPKWRQFFLSASDLRLPHAPTPPPPTPLLLVGLDHGLVQEELRVQLSASGLEEGPTKAPGIAPGFYAECIGRSAGET